MKGRSMSKSQENTPADKQPDRVELDLQDLETLEAPGWWTVGGVVVGITITVIAAT
jgi:hypothetical protein